MKTTHKLVLGASAILVIAACHDYPTMLDDAALDELELPTRTMHDENEQEGSGGSIDPTTHRVVFTFKVESAVSPKSPVTLVIEGVATEAVTGGEVVVTLPTKAAMDYAGPDDELYFPIGRKPPVAGRWQLPQMAAGDLWKQRITLSAMDKGYYQIALNADTHGPPSTLGSYMADDAYRQVWMFVSDHGAALTPFFDETVFPEGTRPAPGPIQARNIGRDAGASAADGAAMAGNSRWIYTEVSYYTGSDDGYQPAAGVEITGAIYTDGRKGAESTYTVPDNGLLRWTCPKGSNKYLGGKAVAQATDYVKKAKRTFVLWWSSRSSECGDTISVIGRRDVYMPWNHLNEAAELITSHFGHSRNPVPWEVDHDRTTSSYWYTPISEGITFGSLSYDERWVAAHEYTHALHHKGMGGSWGASNCKVHHFHKVSSYECAFKEGLADYGGNIGAPGDDYAPDWEDWDEGESGTKGKIEGYIAALFHDLIDGGTETDDETEYDGDYVMTVFSSCKTAGQRGEFKIRNDVSDFVWCLENRVDEDEHDDHFPGIVAPRRVREAATEPDDWDADDIRATWTLNLG